MDGCLAATGAGGVVPLLTGGLLCVLAGAACFVRRPRRRAGAGTAAGLALVLLLTAGAIGGPVTSARADGGCADGGAGTSGSGTVPKDVRAIGADQEVTFVSAGVTVHGSYRGPVDTSAAAGPVPAVVIVVGTGAVDRNGDAGSLVTNVYTWLADRFSALGVASLRYDKLGTGATGLGPYTADPAQMLTLGYDRLRVQPVRDALSFVAAQPGVDPSDILLLGHSEGGPIALAAVTDPREAPAPAALLLLEPAYTRILDIIARQVDEQIEADVTGGTVTTPDAAALEQWLDQGREQIRAGKPTSPLPTFPTPIGLPLPGATGSTADLQTAIATDLWGSDPAQMVISHAYRNRYGQEFDAVDPAELAGRVTMPTLITCGTKDFNTPCGDGSPGSGVRALAAAFPPGVAEMVTLPDTVHILRDVASADPDGPADQIAYPFSGVLRDALNSFVTATVTSTVTAEKGSR